MLLSMFLSSVGLVSAQQQRTFSSEIRTLQVVAGNRWYDIPIIQLYGQERIHVDFDVMSHQYRRLVYSIEHCEPDWKISSQLFESDYLDGFADGNTIDDVEQSLNTTFNYTHYSFALPNKRCQLKMSGNYRVVIYDDNDSERRPLAQVCFMVEEPRMGVQLNLRTDTDADIRGRHQQIEATLNYSGMQVSNPQGEITTVLLQNNRWTTAVWNAQPSYVMPDGLRWQHCRDFIFDGGNEYRKFEVLDTDHATLGLQSIQWDGQRYHAFIYPDMPRPNYVYDEDANGAYFIRNSDNIEINTTTDYVYVHFQLPSPLLPGQVCINGQFTNDSLAHPYVMQYNAETEAYELTLLLKQGYYSYQYVQLPSGKPLPSEENFFQTENIYTMLVYYRAPSDRTSRLLGVGRLQAGDSY